MFKKYEFSEKEDAYVLDNYLKMPATVIAKHLGVSPYVLRRRYKELNIQMPEETKKMLALQQMGVTNLFTEEEDQFIKDNYLKIPIKTMGRMIGRSGSGIRNRMKKLGLEVPEEIKQSFINKSYFQKGHTPMYKGKKLPPEVYERIRATFFKKGNVPHNVVPIGSERETKDGYIEVKVFGNRSHRNWKLKHRVVWEQHYGSIPKGHNVQFIDGNRKNCAIENLYLISKNDNLEKNSFNGESLAKRLYRYTPEEIEALKKINPHILDLIELQFKVKRALRKKST